VTHANPYALLDQFAWVRTVVYSETSPSPATR
jgi:hypothetical protein